MNLKNTLSNYIGKPNSLFKKIFVISLFAYLPFLILYLILAGFGMPVNFNDGKIYGLKAVIVLISFTPFMVLMLSVFAYLFFVLGNFVLRIFIKLLPDNK